MDFRLCRFPGITVTSNFLLALYDLLVSGSPLGTMDVRSFEMYFAVISDQFSDKSCGVNVILSLKMC